MGEPTISDVSDDYAEVILAGPAVWANMFFTTTSDQGIKITFAEKNPSVDSPAFRAAIYMDYLGLLTLQRLLEDVIESRRQFLEEQQKSDA